MLDLFSGGLNVLICRALTFHVAWNGNSIPGILAFARRYINDSSTSLVVDLNDSRRISLRTGLRFNFYVTLLQKEHHNHLMELKWIINANKNHLFLTYGPSKLGRVV